MKQYFDAKAASLNSHDVLLPLVEMAMQRGINNNKLLKGSKLFYTDLQSPHKKVSFEQLNTVINNAILLLPSDGLSFLLGQHWLFNQVSYSGQALLNSKHLMQMSRVIQVKQFALCPFVFFTPYRSHSHTHYVVNFAIALPQPKVTQFYFEMIAAKINALCKWRFNFTQKICIKFPFSPPQHLEQYYAHLGVQYQFDHPCFCISIPNETLTVPQATTTPVMQQYYLQQARTAPNTIGFIQYLCELLIKDPKIGCEEVAQHLRVSPATLKRKLKQHNTTLQTLKDALQKQHAVINIGERGYSNEQTADHLQFSDVTNFRRTFKRWTGMTPTQLRNIMT
ncbi:hypothetical protein PCIT_a2831 [Pseudoalteromonas citrea]|uniref:HTH araC/xylS-type domain-containing protein n=2 Tax=Pseudoalteromonas citrea TaxID=43655 RepID=A0AAD4AHN8_9GAMM|nr:helix-turn-helix transcriptional regulator [Pseudoalteromonas citrea]KAF7769907.1 hypothetical protein PCIT_a2831 [Pseudoalteromonas citrea]